MASAQDCQENLRSFLRKREALNTKLVASCAHIDKLLGESPLPPSIPMLADLEVMLQERRDLLAELGTLDDELMLQLIGSRTRTDS